MGMRCFRAGFCAVVGLVGLAGAAETAQDLRQPAIEHCQAVVAPNPPPSGAAAACSCVVDRIIADFGPDAAKMLKVLIADIRPADVALAAALLQVSETEARRFLEAAQARMGPIEKACVSGAQARP